MLSCFRRLGERLDQTAGTLSGGERKMLAIGRAVLARPWLLMLDEPTEGVWHGVIDEITERGSWRRKWRMVVVEQHLEAGARRCAVRLCHGSRAHRAGGESGEIPDDPELVKSARPRTMKIGPMTHR